MRVLHVVHQYLPDQVGGTELYTHWLVQGLQRRGHHVTVFYRRNRTGNGLDCRDDGNGVRICAAWSGSVTPEQRFLAAFSDRYLVDAFRHVLHRAQPDLVHIQHLMGLPIALVRRVMSSKVPFVITLHDYWWVCANAQLLTNYSRQVCDGPRAYANCARCALARAGRPNLWPALPVLPFPLAWRNVLLRRVLGAANWTVAPTAFVRDWYVTHGAPRERISVIPHGLDLPTQIPRRPPKKDRPLRYAYIGGLSWQKGVHVALEAFGGIKGNAEFWVAGDESADPDYVSHLREQAPPNVRFLGKLAREGVWEILSQVDAVVAPSVWYETFSFLVSEAFAAGLPVIASRLGALAERVSDGVDGLLVPPGDVAAWREALQRLVDEPDLLRRLRSNVQPPLTLDEHVDQIESVYSRVLDLS
jgi:glycosyltransferase involved in cell wall biosynthesis